MGMETNANKTERVILQQQIAFLMSATNLKDLATDLEKIQINLNNSQIEEYVFSIHARKKSSIENLRYTLKFLVELTNVLNDLIQINIKRTSEIAFKREIHLFIKNLSNLESSLTSLSPLSKTIIEYSGALDINPSPLIKEQFHNLNSLTNYISLVTPKSKELLTKEFVSSLINPKLFNPKKGGRPNGFFFNTNLFPPLLSFFNRYNEPSAESTDFIIFKKFVLDICEFFEKKLILQEKEKINKKKEKKFIFPDSDTMTKYIERFIFSLKSKG